MKNECIRRLKYLNLCASAIDDFEKLSKISMSDKDKIVDVPENILKDIEEWEKKYGNMVYHVIHTSFMGMDTYECLSVSKYPEDWNYEREIMMDNWVMSHSINLTIPEWSESGSIKVKEHGGILTRVG